ncbi:sensor histidine kinase N-terminal domain-containing protein [Ramlibacter sp. AW1]|uniref:histidine kinase n=1 Tax=Ramlibacter aurantiacus TaxID=2801330 RepID=A0A937D336_9BURK|nr:ATP-binding protein [Ramlibacter aurantiacus]MBL0422254.1 sensor histidine kinase N-terminal domain-containing protein [Ramlibacter aurantiacus]
MLIGLRRRLMVMLMGPLLLLSLVNAWLEYRAAGNVATLQDQQLQALLPLLADSLIADDQGTLHLLAAPGLDRFLQSRPETAAYGFSDSEGRLLHGASWLAAEPLARRDTAWESVEHRGMTWRVVRQRQKTVLGDTWVALADASDPRQQWVRAIAIKVLLPNLLIILVAAVAVHWAVGRALRPLLQLTEAVDRRSPGDLHPIEQASSPEEVRPLVAALNRLFAVVNAQAESQRRFISDAAHQLRTPLAGLQAQVEAWAQAARRIAPPGGPGTMLLPVEQIEKLRGATRRTTQLANQLLALSRADSRSMSAQPMVPVDLKQLCEAMLEQHLDAAGQRGIDLGVETRVGSVPGYEWQLRELLSNLVDNAIRYTSSGGCVTIRCDADDGGPFIEVEDDGPGIPECERSRVLERFYRVKGTQGEGTGLGLAIAEAIARAHGSRLELRNGGSGRGLKVRLTLAGLGAGVSAHSA